MHIYATDDSYIAPAHAWAHVISLCESLMWLYTTNTMYSLGLDFLLLKFLIYLPQYAYFGERFPNYFKMSDHHSCALYSLCPFLPLQSTVSRKIKQNPGQTSWFLRHALRKYCCSQYTSVDLAATGRSNGECPEGCSALFPASNPYLLPKILHQAIRL